MTPLADELPLLSPARLQGLRELAEGCCRRSVWTGPGSLYWQTADWLLKHGFAQWTDHERKLLEITDAGVEIYWRERA